MKIKCEVCGLFCGSKQEYNQHCLKIHKQHPKRKEQLILVE